MKSLMAQFAIPGDAELTRGEVTDLKRGGGTSTLECQHKRQ